MKAIKSEITFTVAGRSINALLQLPPGEGPHRGVVILHDVFGLTDDSHRQVQRFVDAGYAAIAPNLFDAMGSFCIIKALAQVYRGKGNAFPVISAAREHLAVNSEVDLNNIAVIGFCLGGGFALLAAADGGFAVCAQFYGRVPKQQRLEGVCPTIGQFGGKDLMFRGYASKLSSHLTALKVPHEVLVHDAGHSFMNDHKTQIVRLGQFTPMRSAYDKNVEKQAWNAMMAFFDTHLPLKVSTNK